jgi:Increased loss of mitochondrial DNA protein 1
MGHFSSKTLIQAHALFLFLLAVYLTQSPEVITDSDIDSLLGEAVKVVSQMLWIHIL